VIARVFPRRTTATPTDWYAFTEEPSDMLPPNITEVHVSVAFTYDMPRAKELAKAWEKVAPVKIGGPATGEPSGEFIPGMYVKEGYTISSRGCPNKCWFCSVWKREPKLIELPIKDGWIIHDDNLLACSENHIRAVFDMLKRQKHQAEFRGLEAKLLQDWHVELLRECNPKTIYFAYDGPEDKEPLIRAAMMLTPYFNRNKLYAYVLIGYPGDTGGKAKERLEFVKSLGICPYAMLYRDEKGETVRSWRKFQRAWCRETIIYAKNRIETELPGRVPKPNEVFA
jgi:hypothetical protein